MVVVALFLMAPNKQLAAIVRKFDRGVCTPAMILTFALGTFLALYGDWFASAWLWVKLSFVLALSAGHGVLSGRLRRWATGHQPAPDRLHPLLVPAMFVFLCGVVLTVVIKPF